MNDINEVRVSGRLGKDAEVKTLPSGTTVVKFTVAENFRVKDKERTQWHNVSCFGDRYTKIADSLKKGRKVLLTGRLVYNRYEKDGQIQYFTDITNPRIDFMDFSRSTSPAAKPEEAETSSVESPDYSDDIPF